MSIAVLTQVYAEARRLAVAGSVVARGDFRLKKLLPPLEQAGKQAPVFAKVAEAATAVVDGPEASSAAALLDLTSLVTAVLYTQGETGLAGPIEPVETTDLGGGGTQTSARVLKPLLEALGSTGSGRLELIKDAFARGLFRDLRLVRPALGALDDPYPEIADLVAEKVLPLYGKAIFPELRAAYDLKGTKGNPRRLKLMHALDPAAARDLVKSALDDGSKEVKVAAISCLGADDVPFLIEQAAAKAQDVRAAAYQALAKVDKPEAVAALAKAVAGKDFGIAADAIEESDNPKLADVLVAEVRAAVDGLPKQKDKKKVSEAVGRVNHLIGSFPRRDNPAVDALLLDLFARRDELAKIKGAGVSGGDIWETAVRVMTHGSKAVQSTLAAAHADVPPDQIANAFYAGRACLTAAQVFDAFAPYLTAKAAEKKKAKDPAYAKREAILHCLGSGYSYYWFTDELDGDDEDDEDEPTAAKQAPFDPRWLDLAADLKQLPLVNALARPGHPAAQAFAKAAFDAALKKAKTPNDAEAELFALFRLGHPDAAEAFFAAMAKRTKKTPYYMYYQLSRLVPRLPKAALPLLEELVAAMPEAEANHWLDAIQELRTKAA